MRVRVVVKGGWEIDGRIFSVSDVILIWSM